MSVFRVYSEVGKDGYPPEWHETIKHAVREAAGHRCIRCGHPYAKGAGEWSPCDAGCQHGGPLAVWNYEFDEWVVTDATDVGALIAANRKVSAAWRILTVHHLDGDKANCRWWNLVSLCQRCHLRVQRVVVMPRVWPWDHSDWFKPYVAGYYASVYLGEELTREQAEARMDELLALEAA